MTIIMLWWQNMLVAEQLPVWTMMTVRTAIFNSFYTPGISMHPGSSSKAISRSSLPARWREIKLYLQMYLYLYLYLYLHLYLDLMLFSTKAPIEDTIGDFWHCVAYHQVDCPALTLSCPSSSKMLDGAQGKCKIQVNVVVMLTALTEGTKVAVYIFKY